MSKVFSRLLVFFIGVPLVLFLVYLPCLNHLSLHLLVLVVTILSANELHNIFSKKNILLPKPIVIICTSLIPLSSSVISMLNYYLKNPLNLGQELTTYTLIAMILLLLTVEVFTAKSFENSNSRISYSCFIVLYVGYLVSFITKIASINLEGKSITTPLIITYILMVFMCDSIAWLLGVLFGKNNRGFVKASPNKSIAGFIGGFIGSIAAGILTYFLWPEIFSGSIIKIIIVGFFIALSSIVGDLAESIFKRSADVKDSGNIIPGRGGILDSMDSLLMAAPVFYLLVSILYGYNF